MQEPFIGLCRFKFDFYLFKLVQKYAALILEHLACGLELLLQMILGLVNGQVANPVNLFLVGQHDLVYRFPEHLLVKLKTVTLWQIEIRVSQELVVVLEHRGGFCRLAQNCVLYVPVQVYV